MRQLAGKLYEVCDNCGNIVRVDKPLIGSLHICTTDEEWAKYRAEIARRVAVSQRQLENSR